MKNVKCWYLAGPMTGYPQFNFPAFHAAAERLREAGFNVVSPAELDADAGTAEAAMASEHGDLKEAGIEMTHGDFLARDVKLIADKCDGIAFLPGWEKSKGAKLEAFVGILYGATFASYSHTMLEQMHPKMVLTKITRDIHERLRRG